MLEVASLGVPTGAQFGGEVLGFVTFTSILGTLGAEEIAAHQLALVTIRTSFLPGAAVGEAASVLVGQALGRRSIAQADRVTGEALRIAVGFMAACGVVFALFGSTIAHAFTHDARVAAIAQRLLLVAAAFQVLDALAIVLRGALRAAKDVRVPAIIGVVVIWTCVPSAALFLGRFAGWGALGGWVGFIGETSIGSLMYWLRWRRGPWRREYELAEDQRGFSVADASAVRI
jgi:MATE family multidrug resistance protein